MKFRKDTPEKMKRLYRFLCVVLGEDEGTKRYKKYCRSSSEKMLIFKHGYDIGKQKYQTVIKNVSFSRTQQAYIQKYGVVEGTKRWKEKNSKLSVSTRALTINGYSNEEILKIQQSHSTKSKHTKETFISRYGVDEGELRYEKWLTGSKRRSCRSVVGVMERFGLSEEAAREYVNKIQSRSAEYFIGKYGIIDGIKRYETYNKKRLSYPNASSKPQRELCERLRKELPKKYKINGIPLTEQPSIRFDDNTWIFPDIVINDNIVIEFNGNYWHSFPNVIEKDKVKENKLISNGYKLLIVWDDEYQKNKEKIISYLLEKINNENTSN